MYTLKIFRVIFFSGAVTNIVSRKDHNPDLNCIKYIYIHLNIFLKLWMESWKVSLLGFMVNIWDVRSVYRICSKSRKTPELLLLILSVASLFTLNKFHEWICFFLLIFPCSGRFGRSTLGLMIASSMFYFCTPRKVF